MKCQSDKYMVLLKTFALFRESLRILWQDSTRLWRHGLEGLERRNCILFRCRTFWRSDKSSDRSSLCISFVRVSIGRKLVPLSAKMYFGSEDPRLFMIVDSPVRTELELRSRMSMKAVYLDQIQLTVNMYAFLFCVLESLINTGPNTSKKTATIGGSLVTACCNVGPIATWWVICLIRLQVLQESWSFLKNLRAPTT